MPTFDLMPNFFFRTGFYTMFRAKRDYVPGSLSTTAAEQIHLLFDADNGAGNGKRDSADEF